MPESIELASSAIEIKPNSYDGYYARSKALMEMNNFEEAVVDAKSALEKAHKQQISADIAETLEKLYEELVLKLQYNSSVNFRKSIDHNGVLEISHEVTDL